MTALGPLGPPAARPRAVSMATGVALWHFAEQTPLAAPGPLGEAIIAAAGGQGWREKASTEASTPAPRTAPVAAAGVAGLATHTDRGVSAPREAMASPEAAHDSEAATLATLVEIKGQVQFRFRSGCSRSLRLCRKMLAESCCLSLTFS